MRPFIRRSAAALGLALAVALPASQAAGETPQSAADRTGAWEAQVFGVAPHVVPVIPRPESEMYTIDSPTGKWTAAGQVPCTDFDNTAHIELEQTYWSAWAHLSAMRKPLRGMRVFDPTAGYILMHEYGHVLSGIRCRWNDRDAQRKEEAIVEASAASLVPAWCKRFLGAQCGVPTPPDAYAPDVKYVRMTVVSHTGVGINKPASRRFLFSLLRGDQVYRDSVIGPLPPE